MSNITKKAILYCRTACVQQANPVSEIAKQETECRLYAEKHGYEVVQVFHDDGVSGMTTHRPAFRLMLVALMSTPEPHTVIAISIDRLTRDIEDLSAVCKLIGALGGELVFTSDETLAQSARVA